eukprot:857799-Amphidinium_carterae.1
MSHTWISMLLGGRWLSEWARDVRNMQLNSLEIPKASAAFDAACVERHGTYRAIFSSQHRVTTDGNHPMHKGACDAKASLRIHATQPLGG